MPDLYKYGVAVHLYKPIIKRAVVDFAVGADWTPAAGDVKISKDGAAAANVANLPTAITMGNTAMWDYSLSATEMQAAKVRISVADAAAKVVEDTFFEIDTYGNASAQHAVDLSDSVRAGLTALPNAAAEAAGGLYTRGAGAGQINQQANGQVDANVARWLNTAVTAATAGIPDVNTKNYNNVAAATDANNLPKVDVEDWKAGVVPAVNVTGVPVTDLKYILGTLLTETAGQIAAGFKKLFDVAAPVFTLLSVNQTGDSFVRLGAPAGASMSADIAAVKADTAAVKVQTDKLAFTVANQVDANVLDWKSAVAPAMTGDAFARLGAPAGASVSADVAAVKTVVDAIKAKTDQLVFTIANKVDSSIQAAGDFAQAAADKVWSTAARTLTAFGFTVTVAANNDKTGYTTTAADQQAVADEVLNRNIAGGGSGGARIVRDAFRLLRNKRSIAAGTLTVTQEDDATPAWTAAVTTAVSNPVSNIDPA